MIEHATEITYRGELKSCNYNCSYCPFSKRKYSIKEIERDKDKWCNFLNKISNINFKENVSVLIAPYGEALIHNYYVKGIAKLCRVKKIRKVGCQTNLSFNVQSFIQELEKENVNLDKITLWCTYHPEMTKVDEFIEKIKYLRKKINLSVGVVGNPKDIGIIKNLRKSLPVEVYLWINSMDGLNRKYTEEEISIFNDIDPMFDLEVKNYLNKGNCIGGKEHFFIDFKGDIYPCNKVRKTLGNLYSNDTIKKETSCLKGRCDCYLSYSHLKGLKKLDFFNKDELVRVPKRLDIKAIFLDVDGTLVSKDGKIKNEDILALEYLSKIALIYLNTELPYEKAMKKCKKIKRLLSGGSFANGAHIVEKTNNYEVYNYLLKIPNLCNEYKIYSYKDRPYKILMRGKIDSEIIKHMNNSGHYNIIHNHGRLSIVNNGVNKLSGLSVICEKLKLDKEKVMVIGNSNNDLSMIKGIYHSVAETGASKELIEEARYRLKVAQLPYII